MLQWMGGSRRKVTTSRGSTQKRQQQYFEQRRRQQQQHTSCSDNRLEDNVCSAANSERRSLDVLSLKTLSTTSQDSSPRCLNGLEATGNNAAGNVLENSAPQPTLLARTGNPGKDSVEFVSKGKTVCGPPCNTEMKSSTANLELWKNEISVLDILEDDDLKYSFRENPVSEDHVSFSVGGLGKVGTETPSPPHRMEPSGGLLCSKASRGVERSKNILGDLELDADILLQDFDSSLSGKSSKFSSYSTGIEKQIPKMCFPIDGMGFDNFDGSFGGIVCGKRAYDVNEDYNINRYHAHPKVSVDDFFNHGLRDLPWEPGQQREYISEDCWESQNLKENSFKRTHIFHERDTKLPVDSFYFTDSDFTTFHTPEKSINMEEVIPRSPSKKISFGTVGMSGNPNHFFYPVEDPKDSSMSSEESCSSSAVRRNVMDSVPRKREIFSKSWTPKDLGNIGKCFPSGETSHGHTSYVQQGKTGARTNVDTDKFDTLSLPSGMPSRFTVDNISKTRDGWLAPKGKSERDVDSGLASFYKDSVTKSKAYENEPWAEGYMSAFAHSNLGDSPQINIPKSRYAPQERAAYNSPWKPDLSQKSEVQQIPTTSFNVTESPVMHKPTSSMSGYARKTQELELEIENPLAGVRGCKPRKQKIDFFAMGIVQIGDEEGCSYKSNLNNSAGIQCSEFRDVIKSSAAIISDEFPINKKENENQHKEDPHVCNNPRKESVLGIRVTSFSSFVSNRLL